MKNLWKISTIALATVILTSSFYLNSPEVAEVPIITDEVIGNYVGFAKMKYKATAVSDGQIPDIITVDPNISISIIKKGASYQIAIDDNDLKTPAKPRLLKATGFTAYKTGTGFQIPKQQFKSDSGAAVAIVGLKTYTIDSKLVAGIYNRKTKKLKIKFEGEFPKSLDGSLEAMVNLPTEVEFEATRK